MESEPVLSCVFGRLESSHAQYMQLKESLSRTEAQLRRLETAEEDKDNEMIKLKERLLHQQESHCSQTGDLKAQISHLTTQLQKTENAWNAASHRASLLHSELRKTKGKPAEYQVARIQLEAVNLENKHLKELIAEMESKTMSMDGQQTLDETSCDDVNAKIILAISTTDQNCSLHHTDEEKQMTEWELNKSSQPAWLEDRPSKDIAYRAKELAPILPTPLGSPHPCGNTFIHEELPDVGMSRKLSDTLESQEEITLQRPSQGSFTIGEYLQEEERRSKDLERLLDSYINQFHSDTEKTLRRHGPAQHT
ncbi:centrosomal protein of 63 kDa-like [Amia ocellicauda]|uniref:centrosomal protein of 63 kDa-like n=1 Tax=Amia ocellicauda TaxID=2972642 RepID=UPI00346464B0